MQFGQYRYVGKFHENYVKSNRCSFLQRSFLSAERQRSIRVQERVSAEWRILHHLHSKSSMTNDDHLPRVSLHATDYHLPPPPHAHYNRTAPHPVPVQQDQTYDIEEEEEHKEMPAQSLGKGSRPFSPDRFERSSRSEHELLQGADIVPDDQPEHQSHTDGGDNANETEDAPQENGGETRSISSVRTFVFVFVFSDIFGEEQFEEET